MDPLDPRNTALLTDLYQVTMAASLWDRGHNARATFEVHFRSLPTHRGYVLACGAEQIAGYLLDFQFQPEQVHFLRNLYVFHNVSPEFWDHLTALRFTGDLWAVPEGTPLFPHEPLLRITAPMVQAQLFETYVLATLGYQSMVATKAARMVQAADGRDVVDFGSRRGHGPGAGVLAARAAYCAGAAGTSNVEAGQRLGIPVFGTMAHSFVMAYGDESAAFRAYLETFPNATTLILDTYDTLQAARRVAADKLPIRAVRLDSGDLAALAKEVRAILDAAGMNKVKILASGDLDEYRIAELVASGAPIDSFGVGTQLATSGDAPHLGVVYKLVEIERDGVPAPVFKSSTDKATLPGAKQVYRRFGMQREARRDTIALASEDPSGKGAPLLSQLLKDGRASVGRAGLETIREFSRRQLATLPESVRRLRDPEPYPVELSDELTGLRDRLKVGAADDSTPRPTPPVAPEDAS